MPLVINSLGGGDTHTHTHTHTCKHTHTHILIIHTGSILRNQARAGHRLASAWFKKSDFSVKVNFVIINFVISLKVRNLFLHYQFIKYIASYGSYHAII